MKKLSSVILFLCCVTLNAGETISPNISYELPIDGNVSLGIFDQQGAFDVINCQENLPTGLVNLTFGVIIGMLQYPTKHRKTHCPCKSKYSSAVLQPNISCVWKSMTSNLLKLKNKEPFAK